MNQRVAGEVIGLGGEHVDSVFQDDDLVGDLEYLLEPVRDIDDDDAFGGKLANFAEQNVGLARRKDRCRFIEDQNFWLAGERLGDLDDLLLGHAELGDETADVDPLKAETGQFFGCDVIGSLPVDPPSRATVRHLAEQDIFRNAYVGEKAELLIYGADAEFDGVARIPNCDRLAVEGDFARVRLNRAGQDLDERGLSRAVFAAHRQHMPRVYGERYVRERRV